jgi:hypothetical protein
MYVVREESHINEGLLAQKEVCLATPSSAVLSGGGNFRSLAMLQHEEQSALNEAKPGSNRVQLWTPEWNSERRFATH